MQGVLQFNLFGVVRRDGDLYFAHCPPLDVTTQGKTQAEARNNLIEATELFVISCVERGTLDQALRELGFVKVQAKINRRPANSFAMNIPIPLRFQRSSLCPA
jgi:predicted RNase H-like HicB family nuclease